MKKLKFKNMLVTGAAGFIGSNFVHHILHHHPDITVVSYDKLTYAGNQKNLDHLPDPQRHIFVQGDICDMPLVAATLRKHHVDTIVHFAAESHVDRSIVEPASFVQTNIVGTFMLLEAARTYWLDEKHWQSHECRFHHISTDEVYGELGSEDPAFTEKHKYLPNSPYSASKASSDHLVRAYFRTYHLPVTLSNCSNNYGPRQHDEKLIPTVIRCCLEHRPIPLYGNGSHIRDWLYVEDHCDAIRIILEHGVVGETYNVGSGAEKDNLSLVKHICTILDHKRPVGKPYARLISFVSDRPGHDWRYGIDAHKIRRELNWRPRYDLWSGLEKTVDHYLQKSSITS
jgi:dTDP-glucose 4,6-dehydratase